SQAASAAGWLSQCTSRPHGPPPELHRGQTKLAGVSGVWSACLSQSIPRTPEQSSSQSDAPVCALLALKPVPSAVIPHPLSRVAQKPYPAQAFWSRRMAVMSAYVSLDVERLPIVSLSSRAWPHSWSNTAAISPVFRQPPPDLKNV